MGIHGLFPTPTCDEQIKCSRDTNPTSNTQISIGHNFLFSDPYSPTFNNASEASSAYERWYACVVREQATSAHDEVLDMTEY